MRHNGDRHFNLETPLDKPSKYADAPALTHLEGESARSLLVQLRHAVAPILDNNILPHFTDHSVLHSDGVTQLVDMLIGPLQKTDERLDEKELIILYSACYLHDIGLQYENAGETKTISGLQLAIPWNEQPEDARRNLLRQYHHLISAEMVHASVRAEAPIIGLQLKEDYEPSKVACLCESHNLYMEVESDHARYLEVTEDGPGIRMGLLAGLLRVADILEESRRRATRPKARTLMLDITSQMHWWRHYFTEDIVVNERSRSGLTFHPRNLTLTARSSHNCRSLGLRRNSNDMLQSSIGTEWRGLFR